MGHIPVPIMVMIGCSVSFLTGFWAGIVGGDLKGTYNQGRFDVLITVLFLVFFVMIGAIWIFGAYLFMLGWL